jgi:predicted NBD/HSP70 family sugar kinase
MYAAVDVGGTKTLVAVFKTDGTVVEQTKFPTPKNYQDFIERLAINVANLSTKEFQAIGFAIPGKIDRKHGVGLAFGNLPWENVPMQADAEKIFRAPVVLENDAKLAGLSEAIELKDDYKKVLYMTVSTGIGGGLITNGKIDPGFEDIEIGQILLEHGGKLQRWEEFASGSAIYRTYNKKVSEIDPDDHQTWYMIARNLAIGIIDLVATLTPEVIVIGGGVGSHYERFGDRLAEQLKIYENPLLKVPPIIKAKRAEEAVVYGCYEVAKAHHRNR